MDYERIIVVTEECHGTIGFARDYEGAINFLIKQWHLSGDECVYRNGKWTAIKDILGEDWEDKLYRMDMEEFNEFFGETYCLDTETLW